MNAGLNFDYSLLIPEYVLGGLALLILALDLAVPAFKKDWLPWLTAAGLAAAFAISFGWIDQRDDFAGLIAIDNYTAFFRCFFTATAFFIAIASAQYVQKNLKHPGEYYGLLVISTIGAIYMAAAEELLTAYISLELLSFSLYILVSFAKRDSRSNEAGMKYMLLGAFASAFLLYGISFIYGATGSTSYAEISAAFSGSAHAGTQEIVLGMTLLIGGLGFKVAAVPFHMWTPDAYEGAPLPITSYLSATSKAAGMALIIRLFSSALLPVASDWRFMIGAISAITMLMGNVIAIQQHNIKRLLAYSSIGQVGYMLMGVAALVAGAMDANQAVISALLLHMTGYVITNLTAFTAIIAYNNLTGAEDVHDFRGMSDRAPFLALVLTVALFSLAGMPLFAGFLTKFIFFQSVTSSGYFWLAGLAVVASLISLYYYLYVIREMYISPATDTRRLPVPAVMQAAVGILALGVLFVGLYPSPWFDITNSVSKVLFS